MKENDSFRELTRPTERGKHPNRGKAATTSGSRRYDTLSNCLDRYTLFLDESLRHRELGYRGELIRALQSLDECRRTIGRLLWEYKNLFKQKKIWTNWVCDVAEILRRSPRTLHRWVYTHEKRIGMLPPRKPRNDQDLESDAGNELLTDQQVNLLLAHSRFRRVLSVLPDDRRVEILTTLIAVEAYKWGQTSSFDMKIVPVSARQYHGRLIFD